MSLSDAKARNAKPKAKPYKIADSEGLFLFVTPSGKYWRLKKENGLRVGLLPEAPKPKRLPRCAA